MDLEIIGSSGRTFGRRTDKIYLIPLMLTKIRRKLTLKFNTDEKTEGTTPPDIRKEDNG